MNHSTHVYYCHQSIICVQYLAVGPKTNAIENCVGAIEFQLYVARNGYELNAWVGLLTKVCNLTHNRFSRRYDWTKKKLQQNEAFYKATVYQ